MATDPRFLHPDLSELVPRNLRNPVVLGLTRNLFNRFLTRDEAVPLYGWVGRRPSSPDDRTPPVPALSPERDINALVPVISWRAGAEVESRTPEDLVRKARVLGCSPRLGDWLFSQGNNLVPPIDLDRFTNFFNWYWIARAVPNRPDLPWNPDLEPEYYTIAQPALTDTTKLNVRTVGPAGPLNLTGTGFFPQTWRVVFLNDLQFEVRAEGVLIGFNNSGVFGPFNLTDLAGTPVGGPWPASDEGFSIEAGSPLVELLRFVIRREARYDDLGGFIGYEGFEAGDEFTISAPFLSSSYNVVFNGGVAVKGKIVGVRSLDRYQTVGGVELREGDRVLIRGGSATENGIWIVRPGDWERAPDWTGDAQVDGAEVWVREGTGAGELWQSFSVPGGWGWTRVGVGVPNNTNDWQEGNFWVRRDQLVPLGVDLSRAVQATRPIIEFSAGLELNGHWTPTGPSNSGTPFQQRKTEFNAAPLFNLYRYDGTHSGRVSSVFFYSEDPTASIDPALQRRPRRENNASADWVFEHGCLDGESLLFFKNRGRLETVWRPGYSEPTIGGVDYVGQGDGTLTVTPGSDTRAPQQVWTLECIEPTLFRARGSKTPRPLPDTDLIQVGVPFVSPLFNATITAGSTPFVPGDRFLFSYGNVDVTRYVERTTDDLLVDVPGGEEADVDGNGAWQIHRAFFSNLEGSSGRPVSEGTLYSHLRSVLTNQLPGAPLDPGFGGTLKLWSEPINLLVGILNQRDLTPASLVDLSQRLYENSTNSVVQLFLKHGLEWLNTNGAVTTLEGLDALVDHLLDLRMTDADVRTVLYDSTSPVRGFPATLPLLGATPLHKPGWVFDGELDATYIRRHDGSALAPFVNDTAFRDNFGPPGTALPQDMAALLNDVLLRIEGRLHDGISATGRTYWSEDEVQAALTSTLAPALKIELAAWAALNGYDQTASDYLARDAFTWNYSAAAPSTVAALDTPTVPARWYNILKAHQRTIVGVLPTSRPDIEPWRLLGFEEDPGAAWDMYRAVITPTDVEVNNLSAGGTVSAVLSSLAPLSTPLSGVLVVDGVALNAGDRILLTSEASAANNGVWTVSSGAWTRPAGSLTPNRVWTVTAGQRWGGTRWVLTDPVPVPNTSPVNFVQVRRWTESMWADIEAARPGLKLSVNRWTDDLLPPYVNPGSAAAADALSTSIPPNPEAVYAFGEDSRVEAVWKRTAEYRYSLVRALAKTDPLGWLGNMWGFEWVEVDRILYDGYDVAMPGPARFRLHGEPSTVVTRRAALSIGLVTGAVDPVITFTRDAYTAGRQQSWTVRDEVGTFLGYVVEGTTYPSLTALGYTFTNLRIEDEGQPFRVGDRIVLRANANGSGVRYTFEPSPVVLMNGFCQIFSQALRDSSIDSSQGYAINAFRNWNVNLGHRAGGLVSTDDLQVFNDVETIPDSAYELRLKRSEFAADLWVHALRVTVQRFGTRLPAEGGTFVASTDASDWVFKIQGYNRRAPLIKFSVLDTSGAFETFKALQGSATNREWRRYTSAVAESETTLPIVITGLQNVLNFLFGYEMSLMNDGWRFASADGGNVDAETGRLRDWGLEVEKLIDRVYRGIAQDQGVVVNPFSDQVWLETERGLVSRFYDTALFDVSGHPAAFDALGEKISAGSLSVMRDEVRTAIKAEVPMFSVHAQVDEFEHLFVFQNQTSPSTNSGLVYDPFSGARIATIKFNGRKQGSGSLRPDFGGHYIVGGEVKKNIQASTDLVAKYYDTDTVFQDEKSTRHAMALLGFSPKKYMSDLDLNDRSQFNFWRGLVQMKGTNGSIDAFLNNARFEDARLDEYWAYKVAEYGDSRSKIFPELRLSVRDTLQQFTKLQFDVAPAAADNTFTQISSSDEDRWFSIDDLSFTATRFESKVVGTFKKIVQPGDVVSLPFVADRVIATGVPATQVNATTWVVGALSGELTLTGYGASTPNFSPVKLLNYVEGELIEDIPFWHPAFGQHTPRGLESVNIISNRDPARYNFSTLVAGNSNFDPLRTWGAKEVGRIWWDTTNLAYVPYYDQFIYPQLDQRLNRWGTLADYASIDVVEWVESTVPPVEYDARARQDAGNADLDPATKADGEVYGAKGYERTRQWQVRPIAWSRSAVPLQAPHIGGAIGQRGQFSADYNARLYFASDDAGFVLDVGTFAAAGIEAGMRIGAIEDTSSTFKARSESLIERFRTHVSGAANLAVFTPVLAASGALTGEIKLESTAHSGVTGELLFSSVLEPQQLLDADGLPVDLWDIRSLLRVRVLGTDVDETVLIRNDRGVVVSPLVRPELHGATFDIVAGERFVFDIQSLSLRVTFTASTSASGLDSDLLADMIASELALQNLSLFDACEVSDVVPFETDLVAQDFLSNNFTDPDNLLAEAGGGGIGWRAWAVPTAEQLAADAIFPESEWYPILGDFIPVQASTSIVQDAATGGSFALNNGEVVQRYKTTWGAWSELKQVQLQKAALVTGDVVFSDTDVNKIPAGVSTDRISVYVNGVAQLTGTYELIGTTLTVFGVPRGHQVVTVVRPYTPTTQELEFNPDVEDNLLIQKQYKVDYQYVEVPVRNADGAISTTKYYFWVKNRSTAARNKTQSVRAITQLLTDGPSQYITFQNLEDGAVTPQYNSITISGLSFVVTRDDAFKLRFTRDFTLRDDPNGLDLKETHTEWALIRPGQRTRIPEDLWNKVVNSACGQDTAGNQLPSPQRVAYDQRNGTTSRFGFGRDQILAPPELITGTLLYTILNTKLVDESGPVPVPDYLDFLDFNQSESWFATPESTRNILTRVWAEGKVSQVNELFFAVLEDIVAANYELTDIFKTSRLSAYSIKVVRTRPAEPTYE